MVKGEEIELSIPERANLGSFFLDVNLELGRADKPALYYKDDCYSFRDLWLLTNKAGNVLRTLGVEPENRVLLVLGDSPAWIATWLATLKVGAVGTHAYTYLNTHDYEYLLDLVRPKVVVIDRTTLERMRKASRHRKHPKALMVSGVDPSQLGPGEFSFEQMIAAADHRLETEPTHRDDLAFWNFSGGTTGKPKGVPHTHRDGIISYHVSNFTTAATSDDVVLRVPKLFFHYSRDTGCLYPLRNGAANILFEEKTTAALVFELINKHRPTILVNVPTMMRAMIQTPAHERADLSCIRRCMSSGEVLSAQLYEEWVNTFGGEVSNRFGSAETSMGYLVNRPGSVVPGSSGRVTPLAQIKLVNDEGSEVVKGDPGILIARCPAAGVAYVRDREKSTTTFLGDYWVNTGDVFIQDERDYFWFVGRANEMIKVSGIWVSPLEIEKALEESPHVRECAALAIEDKDGLINIQAFVVPADSSSVSEAISDELKQFCKRRLAPHKFPRVVQFVNDLPKTGAGKIDRLLVKKLAAERAMS